MLRETFWQFFKGVALAYYKLFSTGVIFRARSIGRQVNNHVFIRIVFILSFKVVLISKPFVM